MPEVVNVERWRCGSCEQVFYATIREDPQDVEACPYCGFMGLSVTGEGRVVMVRED